MTDTNPWRPAGAEGTDWRDHAAATAVEAEGGRLPALVSREVVPTGGQPSQSPLTSTAVGFPRSSV